MKYILVMLVITACLFNSCNKTDEITVNLKSTGTLSVKLTDNNSLPLIGTKVKLYDYYSTYDYGSILDESKTDNSGFINFGELNSGTYYLVADTPKVNHVKYLPIITVQIVSGSAKNVLINVEDYKGVINFTFLSGNYSETAVPFVNLGVLAIPYELYNYNLKLDELLNYAEFKFTTPDNGKVRITLPSSRVFTIVVYSADKSTFSNLGYIYLDKDEIFTKTIYLDPYDLYNSVIDSQPLNRNLK